MAIRVVEFLSRGTKLERFLPKNQHIQRKLLNFENWTNGKVSKIEHNFSDKVISIFFTPRLKTQQPVLPYFAATSLNYKNYFFQITFPDSFRFCIEFMR